MSRSVHSGRVPLDGVEAVVLVWPFLTAEAAPAVLDAVTKHAPDRLPLIDGRTRRRTARTYTN